MRGSPGFSLIEVLIVVGIMSISLLAMTSYMDSTRKEMQRLSARQNAAILAGEVQAALISTTGCRSLLGLASAPLAINPTEAQRADRGQSISLTLPTGEALTAGAKLTKYAGLYANGVYLSELRAVGPSGANTLYSASLSASFSAGEGGFSFADTRLGNVLIEINATSQAVACIPNGPGGVSPITLCTSLGGTYTGTACTLPAAPPAVCTNGQTRRQLDLNCGTAWCGGHTAPMIVQFGSANYTCQSGQWVQTSCTPPDCGGAV